MQFDRAFGRRVAIGAVLALLFLVVAYVALAFVAAIVFAVFLYYAVRPIHRFLARFGLPRRVRAMLALVLFGVPFLVLIGYTVLVVVVEVQAFVEAYELHDQFVDRALGEFDLTGIDVSELEGLVAGASARAVFGVVLASLLGAISTVSSALVQLLVVVVLTYYMLIDGPRFVGWVLDTYDESGALRAYVRAVDPELSMTLFGNIVNVFITAFVAVLTFYTYNFLAPAAVHVPFPALLGALAGIGSLIPVVGIKLVYVPVTIALAATALIAGDPSLLVPVAALFVVSGILVDFVPDFFIRAHMSGEQTHTGLLIVAYVVGPIVFGFYGLFLLPIVLILVIHATYVLLPYVVTGEPPDRRQTRLREYADSAAVAGGTHRVDEGRDARKRG